MTASDFDSLLQQIDDEAHTEGDLVELDALGAQFKLAADIFGRRRELGLSQAALSERCGVPQADISRIERGQGNPTMTTIDRLITAMGGGSVHIAWKAS